MLKFGMAVRMGKGCLAKTTKALGQLQKRGRRIACRSNRSKAVEQLSTADSGPALMLAFGASKAERREAACYGS